MVASKLVIGVAGRIGSGKTEVAHLLESHFGFQYLRYSLVLADWYRTDPSAKARLQQVGWEVMSGDRQRELNDRLIEQVDRDRDCVVDGLRHPIDFVSLKSEFGSTFHLFFVDAPAEIRFQRLRSRYATYNQFIEADSHPVESKIDMIRTLADVVLDGGLSVSEITTASTTFVSALRQARR